MSYERFEANVGGGVLSGGVWHPDAAGPAVLAIHGVTASHLSWPFVAAELPDLRLIAPDLRGRGRSRDLPGPYGIRRHADDMAAVLDHFGIERAVVLGHSMGGFVAVRLADQHPDRVSALVLVDGGLPLARPAGVSEDDLAQAVLGPAASRLSMTFPTREAYQAFWRAHPAFHRDWSAEMAAYADYDLAGDAPALFPSTRVEALTEDSLQLDGADGYATGLHSLRVLSEFIRAPRGLLDEPQALYSRSDVDREAAQIPGMTTFEAHDVNHYTIVMSPGGAAQVAPLVRRHTDAPLAVTDERAHRG